MSKGLFDIFNKGVQKEKEYVDKVLKPQIMERQAYNRAMRGGGGGGISGMAASFAAKKPSKIKWR
jgi:hypothetical protein